MPDTPKEQDYDCTCPKCKAHLRLQMPIKIPPIYVTTHVSKVSLVKD